MKRYLFIGKLLFYTVIVCSGNTGFLPADSLSFRGQASLWTHYNPSNELDWYLGGRYIPEVNYQIGLQQNRLFDLEASANIFSNAGFNFQDSSNLDGYIKPYRAWIRYSSEQFELRAGLQKINFGSASMLRPLMWFDQIDPRDPLKLTDGVWGILGRYYFLNNANLWLWMLFGNENLKGWETLKTNTDFPEIGGRFQTPIPFGEAGLSYHYRIGDSRELNAMIPAYAKISENRIGLDARIDYILGFWAEGSWTHEGRDLGMLNNLEILNIGADYTIGLGNGIYLAAEQLIASSDRDAFAFENTLTFSLLSVSYPLGIFDNLGAILYYDWTNNNLYSFLNWQKQFNNLVLYVMGYWNPKDYRIPTQGTGENLFAGQGIQIMLVYNH